MKIMIFGGTHGNEWTGVMAVLKYEKFFKLKYPDLDLHFVLANPEAYKINRRFKDEDLNRAFQYLHEERPSSYEHVRARELRSIIQDGPTFVIDLHTTTSNMGSTLILTNYNELNLNIASRLMSELADCRTIGSPDPKRKYLGSQSDYGIMIEVGPVANGLVEPIALEKTIRLLDTILMTLAAKDFIKKGSVEIYEEAHEIFYPREASGDRSVYIHSNFQGKDFHPLKGKYTPFQTYAGESLCLNTDEELYPIFINEAAYYPNHLAFTLCRKRILRF